MIPSAETPHPLHRQFREARRRVGLTQAALAARVGCKQSAISMMETGRMDALARTTLEKIADLLGVALPTTLPGTVVPTSAATVECVRLCPNPECPSNLPYLVGGEVFFLPRGCTTAGKHCPLCGEVLAAECPSCAAPVQAFAACCPQCGLPLVAAPDELAGGLVAWVAARQQQAQVLSAWVAR